MTNSLNIKQFASPEEAPNYRQINEQAPEGEEPFKAVNLTDAHIIRKGTEAGRSTVDLLLKDEEGNEYVAMITGRLLRSVAQVIGEE